MGIIGLGVVWVIGRTLVPLPAARIIGCIGVGPAGRHAQVDLQRGKSLGDEVVVRRRPVDLREHGLDLREGLRPGEGHEHRLPPGLPPDRGRDGPGLPGRDLAPDDRLPQGVEPGGGPGKSDRRFFGELEMAYKGTLEIDAASIDPNQGSLAYVETVARRTATFIFDEGEKIYELFSPDGAVYVMKSVSQIVDPSLSLDDLATLGSRLELPAGWSYAPRMLTE